MKMKNFLKVSLWGKLMVCSSLLLGGTACSDDETSGGSTDNGSENLPISEVNMPARNPYLAAEHYSITHFNSAQSDAFPYSVKAGTFQADIEACESGWSGPVNLMTLASTDPDYMWGMSSDRVSYIYVGDGSFTRLAEAALPGVNTKTEEQLRALVADYHSVDELRAAVIPFLGENPQFAMSSGNYVLCDKDNYVYSNIAASVVRYRLKDAADPTQGIEMDKLVKLSDYDAGIATLVGMVMTYDGNLVVVYGKGVLILSRDLSTVKDIYRLPEGQQISNSVAVDEHNGIYVASGSTTENEPGLMQKLVWTGSKLSTDEADGAWQATYDGGTQPPSIKMGMGTGSTPTLTD